MPLDPRAENWVVGESRRLISDSRIGPDRRRVHLPEEALSRFAEKLSERKELAQEITTFDVWLYLSSFFDDEIAREIAGAQEPDTRIAELLSPAQIEVLGRSVWNWVQSIPRRCWYYIPFLGLQRFGGPMLAIGKDVQIVDPTSSEKVDVFKVVSAEEYAAFSEPGDRSSHLVADVRYIRVIADGYHCGGNTRESAVARALNKLKTLVTLGKCLGIFAETWVDHEQMPEVAFASDDYRGTFRTLQLGSYQRERLAKCVFGARAFAKSSAFGFGGLLDIAVGPDPEATDAVRLKNLGENLRKVGIVIDGADSSVATVSMRTACEWMFDSEAEKNQTVSFLYVSIGFEALLGEDVNAGDRELGAGVTSTLAERVSFLVGGGRQRREETREKFREFYRARSKIVHGRVARLSRRDSELLTWARQTLYDCIRSELIWISG